MIPPPAEKMSTMTLQISIMSSMIHGNEDYFGEFGYFMIHSKNYYTYFFELDIGKSLFAVILKPPYEHDDIVSRVSKILDKS